MLKTAILASGRGSNLRALLEAQAQGRLPNVHFVCAVSNKPGAPALDHAREFGVPAEAVDHRQYSSREEHERAIVQRLRAHDTEFVVLAGYMRILTSYLLSEFRNRIMNIHPSLLPAFAGVRGQKQALDYGARYAGLTVHFVDETTDGGPVILQRAVPILQTDTEDSLSARILRQEHIALPLALDLASRGRLIADGRRVIIRKGESGYPELEKDLHAVEPLLVATGNQHKMQEIGQILSGIPLRLIGTNSFPETEEPVEDGSTFLDNARIKARYWSGQTGLWALADDSGLEVAALDGRPGVHSSRYAPTTIQRNARLLAELGDTPPEKRRARFICTAVLYGPGGEEYAETGTLEGQIAFESKGEHGFGYDPVFIPDGHEGRHLAELDEAAKNKISHRARALAKLADTIHSLFTDSITREET